MRFAIYGRKSVFSDKSDSVDNQFRMCHDYINFRFPDQVDTIEQYSDEDYTGANTKRPDLQRLLSDIEAGYVDALVVYQLDRLSRDVRDFSNIYSMMEEHHVMFISINENIDTTTPIGKAMMYVTVVFAQMERETTAARVTDNLMGLAKKGYWTGGNPPYGYVRQNVIANGKKHVTIVPDPEGVEYVQAIFDTFLDKGYTLSSMQTAFKNQGIRTRTGAFFSTNHLYLILTMPFCVEATPDVYDFYQAKGCQMDPASPREKWDGSVGVMVYGRTTERNKKHQRQPPEKWLVCLGLHKPFISANKWLKVQHSFTKNKFARTMKYDISLLKGTLRCSCGSIMSVSRKINPNKLTSSYYCLRRAKMGVETCDRAQINIDLLDEKVLDILRSIDQDHNLIYNYVESDTKESVPDLKAINSRIASCESKIGRLTTALALAEESSASKYVLSEIERLDLDLQALKRERISAQSAERQHTNAKKSAKEKAVEISRLIQGLEGFSAKEKNEIVKNIVKKCIWDGDTLYLTF